MFYHLLQIGVIGLNEKLKSLDMPSSTSPRLVIGKGKLWLLIHPKNKYAFFERETDAGWRQTWGF